MVFLQPHLDAVAVFCNAALPLALPRTPVCQAVYLEKPEYYRATATICNPATHTTAVPSNDGGAGLYNLLFKLFLLFFPLMLVFVGKLAISATRLLEFDIGGHLSHLFLVARNVGDPPWRDSSRRAMRWVMDVGWHFRKSLLAPVTLDSGNHWILDTGIGTLELVKTCFTEAAVVRFGNLEHLPTDVVVDPLRTFLEPYILHAVGQFFALVAKIGDHPIERIVQFFKSIPQFVKQQVANIGSLFRDFVSRMKHLPFGEEFDLKSITTIGVTSTTGQLLHTYSKMIGESFYSSASTDLSSLWSATTDTTCEADDSCRDVPYPPVDLPPYVNANLCARMDEVLKRALNKKLPNPNSTEITYFELPQPDNGRPTKVGGGRFPKPSAQSKFVSHKMRLRRPKPSTSFIRSLRKYLGV